MHFSKSQRLNHWSVMIGKIYDGTQNYYKSRYEMHSHLTEVTGAFGKMLFKKHDYETAFQFLPKMFVWAISLFRKIKGAEADLEEALLIKYPRVCSYCLKAPCTCWTGEKPKVKVEEVRNLFLKNSPSQKKSVNDFQHMFRTIYSESWRMETIEPIEVLRSMYTRLIEELSETAEAIRFHHLYPSNFSNELADYFAWWFALTSTYHQIFNDDREMYFAEDILWTAYPSYCLICGLSPCDCRPGPVRELLSKPALNDLALIDGLTQAENKSAFDKTISEMTTKVYPIVVPISCVRIDVDDFKKVNNEISHEAGDSALKLLVTILRQKVRPRDRIFRVGGDEFALICQDLSALETEGMMKRVADVLKEKKIKGKSVNGEEKETTITLSIGISTCDNIIELNEKFNQADLLAIKSKEKGKNQITRE